MRATPPSVDEIRYFIEVAWTLNISRAAERLGVTQPSVSRAIEGIRSLIGSGTGFGILPKRVALGLKPVKGAPEVLDRVCLVYRADAQSSRSGRLFAQQIQLPKI